MLDSTDEEPNLVREAIDLIEGKIWKDSIIEETKSLNKNETCDLVELIDGRKLDGSKWVFKKFFSTTGQVDKFKS
jgi:hypothetical protein